jgi:predicted DNA-binding transcriptional regulator YafY
MKLFTVNRLAEYFGVNPKTIYRRLWAEGIPAFKVGDPGELRRGTLFGWGNNLSRIGSEVFFAL